MRILIFGDSIVQGFWDIEGGGWPQRLAKAYNAQTVKNLAGDWPEFFNLGISGDRTANVAKRLAYEVEARRLHSDPFLLVFAVGLNDTMFSDADEASTPEMYSDELDALFAAASHYSDKVLFVGLTPVDDKLCKPWIYSSTGKSYKNERILTFEEVLRKFCINNKLPHVQIFEKFLEQQKRQNLLADGLHPNDEGHQLIAELVKPALDKLIA